MFVPIKRQWFVACLAVILSTGMALAAVAGDIETWVQESLNTLGYDVGAADGVMGEKSVGGLKAFQTKKDLPATGEIDGDTVQALRFGVRCETGAYKTETERPLFGAAMCDDLDHLKALLASGVDVGATTEDGQTPLFMVSAYDSAALVDPLVAAGVDVDATSDKGYTALMFAASYGHVATVEALLSAGADRYMSKDGRLTAALVAKNAGEAKALMLVKLEFDDDFRQCVSATAAQKLAGTVIELEWLADTGELYMRYPTQSTLFTARGMPRHVLRTVDSVLDPDGKTGGLLEACETTCKSHCAER